MPQKPLNVAYIDDEPDLLAMFEEAFASSDCLIRTFSNPKIAIAELQSAPPDILFIDYRLPGLNGDQISALLDPNLPKVLISGDLLITPKTKFLKVWSKPFSISEVQSFLNQFHADLITE